MCGLTGILDFSPRGGVDIRDDARRMNKQLRHRGPDAAGVWGENGVAFAHSRLAILDLSPAGAQPMISACSRFVIAFNGEIYNHLDLRRDLAGAGIADEWRGHSDTETLLAAVAHWGLDDTLRRSQGMFALALWDRRERRLSLARDRFGEKPLYWGWAGRAIVFGSELKALRAHPSFSAGVDSESLAQYLRFCYVPAPRTIHQGIYKLEPGAVLEIVGVPPAGPPAQPLRPADRYGSISIRRFWSLGKELERGAADRFQDEGEALEELERALSGSVGRQMLSDVPLGAFLSGGVDSSAIVALMQSQSAAPVRTFTIGFDEMGYDESPHAERVARHLGTQHETMRVTDADARSVIPLLPEIYDEPFADSSQIPMYLVCRAARQQVTVALSGDGGDELFGGYNRYFWGPSIWRRLRLLPSPLRNLTGHAMQSVSPKSWDLLAGGASGLLRGSRGVAGLGGKAHKLAERIRGVKDIDAFYCNLASTWLKPERLLSMDVSEPASQLDDPLPEIDMQPAERMMFQDLRSYLPDDILCKVDRAAMAVSLETRVPFLDADVFKVASRMPLSMKVRGRQGKWALRQVLYRHVPSALIERPKAGFAVPVGQWLRGPLRSWAEDLLDGQSLKQANLLEPKLIQKVWSEHQSGRRDHTERLWSILMFQAWRCHQAL